MRREDIGMDGIRKLLSALVVLAAGIFWATHGHAAAPIVGKVQVAPGLRMLTGAGGTLAMMEGAAGTAFVLHACEPLPAAVEASSLVGRDVNDA